jgi:two-component system chemotaxis sensor kinase CheA
MSNPAPSPLEALSALTEKLALELVFAAPGKDDGLLPSNSLVSDMQDLVSAPGGAMPTPLVEAVAALRSSVDRVFDAGGAFPAEELTRLRDWISWLQSAMGPATRGTPLPTLPAALHAKPAAGVTPSVEAACPAPAAPVADAGAAVDPLVLNLADDAELLREFTNESQEHLQNIELGVLTLEESPTDANTLNSIFRAFHTFKGGSGFLNLRPINRLAHELESLLDLARQHTLTIDSEVIELILQGGDTLKRFVDRMDAQLRGENPGEPILIPTGHLLESVRSVIARSGSPSASAHAPAPAVSVPVTPPSPAPAPASAAPETPAALKVLPKDPPPTPAPAAGSVAKSATKGSEGSKDGGASIKVDTSKLDSLVDLVGEMVIAQSLVAQDPALTGVQSQILIRNLAQLGRITKELQRVAMSLRMVPVRGVFQKMNRLVRDVSMKAGKQVELVTDGEETELDRTIIEVIGDPLVHMIRNAVDHGIEKPDVRVSRGKPALGRVHLKAFHEGGAIVIEIEDDGGGLPKEKIFKKAVERGLVKPDAKLSDSDIYGLIFEPGFSTAEVVTDLSGRGVGMDVVRRNIEQLRGKIVIDSTPGKGSKFCIHLPLTLAIIEGLLVGLGTERFILPTLSVRESFRAKPEMIISVQEREEVVNVRGRLIPLLRLDSYFGIREKSLPVTEAIVVVVEADTQVRCLLVDQLIGKQEVVIKSLGETFRSNPNLAGAAILGDGRVGLILDVAALVKLKPLKPMLAAAA